MKRLGRCRRTDARFDFAGSGDGNLPGQAGTEEDRLSVNPSAADADGRCASLFQSEARRFEPDTTHSDLRLCRRAPWPEAVAGNFDGNGNGRCGLIKLLEAGAMPYETPGRHRRLRLSDVLAYQQTRRGTQRQAIEELAADALSDGRAIHERADAVVTEGYGSEGGSLDSRVVTVP